MTSKKNTFFALSLFTLVVLATLILGELACYLFLQFNTDWPSRGQLQKTLDFRSQQNMAALTVTDKSPGWMKAHILHPYLGFVRNPDLPRHIFNNYVVDEPVNEFGFFGEPPRLNHPNDEITVAITGGSVALELYLQAKEVVRRELQKSPKFAGKQVRVICLALGGMKQPQQLMALNYFLALGRRFDILVNLDGFNEVVLPFANNVPLNTNPFFPRAWAIYASRSIDIDTAVLYAKIAESKERTESWRSFVSKVPFRYSNIFLILWHLKNENEKAEQYALDEQIRAAASKDKPTSAQETGPPYHAGSKQQLFTDCARFWRDSSVEMWQICRANGIAYFHFLQPNQYVPGNKALTDWEKRHAVAAPENLARQGVEKGYPRLSIEAAELKEMGLPFFDLTGLFEKETDAIYKDNCCHLNKRGNDLLAKRIARTIASN